MLFNSFVDIAFNFLSLHLFFSILFASIKSNFKSKRVYLFVTFFDLSEDESEKMVNFIIKKWFDLHCKYNNR